MVSPESAVLGMPVGEEVDNLIEEILDDRERVIDLVSRAIKATNQMPAFAGLELARVGALKLIGRRDFMRYIDRRSRWFFAWSCKNYGSGWVTFDRRFRKVLLCIPIEKGIKIVIYK